MSEQNKFENFLISFFSFYEKQQETVPYNFNVLDEQCGHIVENSHTNMLMKLLQFRNKYGYVFLEDFISMAEFNITIENKAIEFKTEFFTCSDSGKNGRIDGLIYQQGNFAIIIENKINHAGNQEEQIKRYIETVIKKHIVTPDKVYVVFLTRDGIENPDDTSLKCLMDYGICDTLEDNVISGPRYFPCSYSQHIYDWLKDNIQPSVTQKDAVLNAGLIQYVDYLGRMLGRGTDMLAEQKTCREWFDKNIVLPNDIIERNAYLYNLYKYLLKQATEYEAKEKAINVLKNVIEIKNDELLENLLTVTENFFASGKEPLMQKYHMNHHFTYYYIDIRDDMWPKGVQFAWYPLGLKKLCKENELTFYFKSKGERLEAEKEQLLDKLGFKFHDKSRTYRRFISVPKGEHGNGTFLSLNEKVQRQFLESVYREYAEPIIRSVIPML